MSILIAVPTFESVKTEVFSALWRIGRTARGGVDLSFVKGYDCKKARTAIAQLAIDGGHSHVLMVDSDTVPPPGALESMLSDGVDVCLGYYVRKGHKTQTTVERPSGDPYHVHELRELARRGETVVPARRGGLGCALVKTDVFGRIGKPWFSYEDYGTGTYISEDYWFCRACREAGIGVYVDVDVECGHVMEMVI